MQRPVLERKGKPIQLTADEIIILDDLWQVGQDISSLENQLDELRKRREVLVLQTKARRFLIREIAEIGSLSPAGVCYIVSEDLKNRKDLK